MCDGDLFVFLGGFIVLFMKARYALCFNDGWCASFVVELFMMFGK
jgi:hypothetical protein